jgi:hypothetical protein
MDNMCIKLKENMDEPPYLIPDPMFEGKKTNVLQKDSLPIKINSYTDCLSKWVKVNNLYLKLEAYFKTMFLKR